MTKELANLLNRAAAALETPADLTARDRAELAEDLTAAVESFVSVDRALLLGQMSARRSPRLDPARALYVIAVYTPVPMADGTTRGLVATLGTDPKTLSGCRQSIRWQAVGGFGSCEYAVATPVKATRGEFVTIGGQPRTLHPTCGALTESAFAEFLDSIWGKVE